MNYLFENVDDKSSYDGIQKIKNEKFKIEYQCKLLRNIGNIKKRIFTSYF